MSKQEKKSFELTLHQASLSELQKNIIQERFLKILKHFELRCLRIALLFHTTRFIVTVGSLLVPALLSIQYSDTSNSTTIKDPDSFAYEIYWATWVISLLVTTSNGILSTFKIDKKYYFLHTTLEQLRSEGWQYLELSGRYSGFHTPGTKPSHDNQFIYFCHAVEKMKMKQVEEEYYKLTDSHVHTVDKSKTNDTDKGKLENPLVHPTPLNSLLEQAQHLPPELLRQLSSMISPESVPPKPTEKEEV